MIPDPIVGAAFVTLMWLGIWSLVIARREPLGRPGGRAAVLAFAVVTLDAASRQRLLAAVVALTCFAIWVRHLTLAKSEPELTIVIDRKETGEP